MRIVLASGSPRRRELLLSCGYDVVVQRPDVDETPRDEAPSAMVLRLARDKAATAATLANDCVVVAADTTVVLDGAVLAKPADDADAADMLRRLSGRSHEVLTGYCVRRTLRDARDGVVRTEVTFRHLSQAEIERYVASGEPRDKAGGYGIQGQGGALVHTVHGSYTNVVGLPLAEVIAAIRELA